MRVDWFTALTIGSTLVSCGPAPSVRAATTTPLMPLMKEAPPRGPLLATGLRSSCLLRDPWHAACVGERRASFSFKTRVESLGLNEYAFNALFVVGTVDVWRLDREPYEHSTTLRLNAEQVSNGLLHTCALGGGIVTCWGYNDVGQLGRETHEERGEAMPVALEGNVTALAAGEFHTCALFDDGAVRCWGSNREGQLGIQGGSVRGAAPGDMGAELPAVVLAEPAIAIAAGRTHSCALLTSKRVQCWGSNLHGSLGASASIVEVAPTSFVSLGASKVRLLAAGGYRTCAALEDNTLKCWGRGDFGALGQGHTRSIGLSAAEMGEALPAVRLGHGSPIVEISMAQDHTCVLFEGGHAKCWGRNDSGQLGINGGNRGDEQGEMGEHLPFADFAVELPK